MIFSDTVRYALIALSYLALNRDRLVKVEEIAKVHKIPKPFLAKVMHELSKRGLVYSVKGPRGGFTLTKEPDEITIWDVIKVFGEEYRYQMCLLHAHKCSEFNDNPCVVHDKWEELKSTIVNFFKNTSILDLTGIEERQFQEAKKL